MTIMPPLLIYEKYPTRKWVDDSCPLLTQRLTKSADRIRLEFCFRAA